MKVMVNVKMAPKMIVHILQRTYTCDHIISNASMPTAFITHAQSLKICVHTMRASLRNQALAQETCSLAVVQCMFLQKALPLAYVGVKVVEASADGDDLSNAGGAEGDDGDQHHKGAHPSVD